MKLLRKEKSPIELLNLAHMGGQAETVRKVLSPSLYRELDILMGQLAASKKDVGEYAFLSGQIYAYRKLMRQFEISAFDGTQAAEQLKGGF